MSPEPDHDRINARQSHSDRVTFGNNDDDNDGNKNDTSQTTMRNMTNTALDQNTTGTVNLQGSQSTISSSQKSSASTIPDQIETPLTANEEMGLGAALDVGATMHGNATGPKFDLMSPTPPKHVTGAVLHSIPQPEVEATAARKRTADGMLKSVATASTILHQHKVSGHSRHASTASTASTSATSLAELQATLKDRISFAKFKLDHGWQSKAIDEVETLASQAGSPAMSASTQFERAGSSASPPLLLRPEQPRRPQHQNYQQPPPHYARGYSQTTPNDFAAQASPRTNGPMLAPPISLQSSKDRTNPRRKLSSAKYSPAIFAAYSHSHSQHSTPETPAHPYSTNTSPVRQSRTLLTPLMDPLAFSPQQDSREKDAIETLLFMSSPNNSTNMKHKFESSSQPLPSGHHRAASRNGNAPTTPRRTALPGAPPRKSLPGGGHQHQRSIHGSSSSQDQNQKKHVEFGGSLSQGAAPMHLTEDSLTQQPRHTRPQERESALRGTPHSAAPPRASVGRASNGDNGHAVGNGHSNALLPLAAPSAMNRRPQPPPLTAQQIDAMLEKAAADLGSDTEDEDEDGGEIVLPATPGRSGVLRV